MQYGQIVFLLFTTLVLYYAALIVLDIQKARAAQAAEQDDNAEEDIDISDEAQTFKAVKVSRMNPKSSRKFLRKKIRKHLTKHHSLMIRKLPVTNRSNILKVKSLSAVPVTGKPS